MKFNKAFLGLGVMAFVLASCSDDVEYTPAAPVTAPAAYFSPQEETVFDIEESDDHVNFKVYRAQGGPAQDTPVSISISAEDGSPVPSDLFTFTPTAHFEEGSCLAIIPVSFDYNRLEKSLSYLFDCKVEGNDSQYFLTQVTYDLSYTPWQEVKDCKISDNTTMQVFTSGNAFVWDVTVQEHPLRPGFFRIRAPYADCEEYFANYYNLPDTDPNYLYINATNPEEAFFSDSKGNPSIYYNTGVYCQAGNGFAETYGYITLGCTYSSFLLEEDIDLGNGQTLAYSGFAGYAGKLTVNEELGTSKVKFGERGLMSLLLDEGGGNWGKSWELWLNGASDDEDWASLGMAEYTDGFIGQFFLNEPAQTYNVPVEYNTLTEGLYRIAGAYGINYCPFGSQESNDLKVVIDCSDPEFVTIENQIGMIDEFGEYELTNAGYLYFKGLLQGQEPMSKEEIIQQGLNDTFDEATGTINIAHPAFIEYDNEGKGTVQLLWRDTNHTPGKIVLPQQGAGSAASAVAPKSTAASTRNDGVKIYRKRDLTGKLTVAKGK